MTDRFDDEPLEKETASLLVILWILRAHKAARAHYHQASSYKYRGKWLTLINAFLSILILFVANTDWVKSVFPEKNSHGVITSGLALLLVLTTIFQFILRWSEKTHQHRFAGAEFSNFQRKAERYSTAEEVNMSMLHNLNRDYNHITKSYPLTSSSIWSSAGDPDLNTQIAEIEMKLRE